MRCLPGGTAAAARSRWCRMPALFRTLRQNQAGCTAKRHPDVATTLKAAEPGCSTEDGELASVITSPGNCQNSYAVSGCRQHPPRRWKAGSVVHRRTAARTNSTRFTMSMNQEDEPQVTCSVWRSAPPEVHACEESAGVNAGNEEEDTRRHSE